MDKIDECEKKTARYYKFTRERIISESGELDQETKRSGALKLAQQFCASVYTRILTSWRGKVVQEDGTAHRREKERRR
jgi:hypothetical protein